MAVLTHLIQTTWRGLEGGCHRVAGSHLSGGGLGSVTLGRGHLDELQEETKIQINSNKKKLILKQSSYPLKRYIHTFFLAEDNLFISKDSLVMAS